MSDPPFGHHQLHNRYRFEGSLELDSPLRLSSGRASDSTDAPFMKDRSGHVYIPGSSLRGAIRSELERMVAAAGSSAGLNACTLFERDDSTEACLTSSRAKQDQLKELDEAAALSFLETHLCDVCKLFGSPVYGSKLTIEDAYPASPDEAAKKLVVRDGVGIDRDTGTAHATIKFDFEVLEKGPKFGFRMTVENLGAKDRKLVELLLAVLLGGLYVGGKRSAGLGRVRLEGQCKVFGFSSPEELWKDLASRNASSAPGSRELAWPPGGAT